MKPYMSYLVVTMLNCNLVVLFATFFVFFMTFNGTRQFTVLCHSGLEDAATKLRCTFCCFIWQSGFCNSSGNPLTQECAHGHLSASCTHPEVTQKVWAKKSLGRHFNCLPKSINCSFPEECKDVTRVQMLLTNIPELTSPSDKCWKQLSFWHDQG